MFSKLRHLLRHEDDGATAVEYAVMLALIFLVCLGAIASLGQSTKNSWQNSSNSITTAVGS